MRYEYEEIVVIQGQPQAQQPSKPPSTEDNTALVVGIGILAAIGGIFFPPLLCIPVTFGAAAAMDKLSER